MYKKLVLNKIIFIFIVGSIFIFSACENESIPKTENNIAQKAAIEIAKGLFKRNVMNKGIDITKTIKDTTTYKTESNENAFYAINYNEGGFVIIAADNRISPILAYSDEGKFSNNIDEIPDAVVSWMEEEKEAVEYVKEMGLVQMPEIKLEWDNVENKYPAPIGGTGGNGGGSSCNDTFFQKGPLVKTYWSKMQHSII